MNNELNETSLKSDGELRKAKEYHEAATLAAKLWINQTGGRVNVAMTIVHQEEDPPKEAVEYAADVENDSVKVLLDSAGDMKCPRKAQLVRMYLFEKDFVKDDDLVMTADADAFVIGDNLIKILNQHHNVWIAE